MGVAWVELIYFSLACLGTTFSHSADLKTISSPSTFKFQGPETQMVGFIQLLSRSLVFAPLIIITSTFPLVLSLISLAAASVLLSVKSAGVYEVSIYSEYNADFLFQ